MWSLVLVQSDWKAVSCSVGLYRKWSFWAWRYWTGDPENGPVSEYFGISPNSKQIETHIVILDTESSFCLQSHEQWNMKQHNISNFREIIINWGLSCASRKLEQTWLSFLRPVGLDLFYSSLKRYENSRILSMEINRE